MERKKAFRKQQLGRLSQMTPADRRRQNQALQTQLFASPTWQTAQVIAMTISSDIEVATRPLIEQAWAEGKMVVIPKTLPHRQMAFYPYQATDRLERTTLEFQSPSR